MPFQRGLYSFVEFGGFVKVDDVDVAVGGADDEELVAGVEGVDAVLTVYGGDGGGLSEVPVFDCFVPGASHKDGSGLAWDIDEACTSDGLIMRCNLLGCGVA